MILLNFFVSPEELQFVHLVYVPLKNSPVNSSLFKINDASLLDEQLHKKNIVEFS